MGSVDWFFNGFDHLMQSYLWKSILAHFEWIDWATLLFLFLGIVFGIKNGLLRVLVEIIELLVVIYLVFKFYKLVGVTIQTILPKIPVSTIDFMGFFLTMIVTWGAMAFIDSILRKLINTQLFAPLRIIGGALAGGFYLILVLSFFAQAAVRIPHRPLTRVFDPGNSYTGHYLVRVIPKVYKVIDAPVQALAKGV